MCLSYGRLCYLDLLMCHRSRCCPWSLVMFVRQQPVLPAIRSVLLQSVMSMNVSFYYRLCCQWTCLSSSSLCCPWTWLIYSGQSCPCRVGLYTAASAAPDHVCSTAVWGVRGHTVFGLQQPVLSLDLPLLQQAVLPCMFLSYSRVSANPCHVCVSVSTSVCVVLRSVWHTI
jgi:hypothetical protein